MTYDYSALIAEINSLINTNGTKAITGAIANQVFKDMVDSTYNKVTHGALVGFNQHNSGVFYRNGQMVQRNGKFSVAKRDDVTGNYSTTNWSAETPGGVVGYQLYQYPDYNPASTYTIGQYVKWEYNLYKAKGTVSPGVYPNNSGSWDAIPVNNNKFGNPWVAGSFSSTDVVLGPDNLLYRANVGSIEWISTNFASDVTAGYWINIGGSGAGGSITQLITSGDLTHSPSGDAVYNAITTLNAAIASGDVTTLAAAKVYADGLVVGLLNDRGNFTPSGSYPSTGGSGPSGAIRKGDLYTVAGLGAGVSILVGTKSVSNGDVIRALVNGAVNSDSQWAIAENNFGYVALNQALASGMFYVGNVSGVGTAVTMSGDATLSNAGVLTIGLSKITNSMIVNGTINLTTKVTGTLPTAYGGTGVGAWGLGEILVGTTGSTAGLLGVGTLGQVLTIVNFPGVGNIPRWADATGGGSAMTVTNFTGSWTTQTLANVRNLLYTVAATGTAVAKTINLNATPATGDYVVIKDKKLDAGTNNITVDGNGKTIDGDTSVIIDNDGQGLSLMYDGAAWNLI